MAIRDKRPRFYASTGPSSVPGENVALGRRLCRSETSAFYQFKAQWYTVWHICAQNSKRNLIYAHISMPATLTENTLEWVDLDLDYRVHLDGSIERLDEQEFDHNIQVLKYPPDVIAQARTACEEVERLYQRRAFPFNHQEQAVVYREIKTGEDGE